MEGDTGTTRNRRRNWNFNPLPPHGGRLEQSHVKHQYLEFQSTPSAWRETYRGFPIRPPKLYFNPLPPHGGRLIEGDHKKQCIFKFQSTPSAWRETAESIYLDRRETFQSTPSAWRETSIQGWLFHDRGISIHSLRMEGDVPAGHIRIYSRISIHSLRMEGDSKTAQESVFHFAYPCTILQKRMQKTTFCTRKNGFFRKKGEKFGAKPSASFCAPMIRTDTFPLNFSHRISGSSMSMVSFAPICSTFD